MELDLYLAIVRRRWPLVLTVTLLVALISLVAALLRPPVYGLTARLLVTRGLTSAESSAGLTSSREDTVAQDVPAIVSGDPFARDVAQTLAEQDRPIDEASVAQALSGANQRHEVLLSITTEQAEDAAPIARAAIDLLRANGLRYWGDTTVTPDRPGINVEVLDLPASATRLNGPRAIAIEVALRSLVGLIASVGLAFVLHYLDGKTLNSRRAA